VSDLSAAPGVVTVPQSSVHLDIQRQVTQFLQGVQPGTTMAVLNLHSKSGVNLAVAHKFGDHWDTALWIGKSGWDTPLKDSVEGGVTLTYSR